MRHIGVVCREKAGLGVWPQTGQNNAILQFFLVFTVIMRYYSADTGTVSISEEWHGRVFSLVVFLLLLNNMWNVRKERFKIENQLLFLED